MSFYEDGSMFEIKYIGEDGKKHTTKMYAESKSDAQRMFNEDKEPGEKLLSVKKINS